MKERPRVLIIEENEALRAMLFTILRRQSVEVDTAATAEDALSKVLSCDYALILIDMDLAASQAVRFLIEFGEKRPGATSLVIALRDPRNDIDIDSDAVAAILDKPLEIDMLAEVVRECALLVPRPDDPIPCPPAESDVRARLDRGSHYQN